MSIVETLPRLGRPTGSGRIQVGNTTLRQPGTRAKLSDSDRTGADLRACALEEQASAVLRSSSYHAVRQLSCEVSQRVLLLRGRVPNFYMKQMAQTVVRDLLGNGFVIDNRVEVDRT